MSFCTRSHSLFTVPESLVCGSVMLVFYGSISYGKEGEKGQYVHIYINIATYLYTYTYTYYTYTQRGERARAEVASLALPKVITYNNYA